MVDVIPDVIVPEIDTRPMAVTLGEAADLLKFSKRVWEPAGERPGLN